MLYETIVPFQKRYFMHGSSGLSLIGLTSLWAFHKIV